MKMSYYPNVDTWVRPEGETPYVTTDGKNVRMNLRRFIPNSAKLFREEDTEIYDALETFIIERGLFLKKIDVLTKYMDYFIEFFDEDKELPVVMLYLKNQLDSNSQSITIIEYLKLIERKFFRDTSIKQNIYRMVEANYNLDVTVDAKSGRVFNGPNDFTNDEVKRFLAISMFMKFIIPVTSQYISTNTLYDKSDMYGLLTRVFVDVFYYMGTYGDEDADTLMTKLYIFTADKIVKHHGANSLLWQQQCALRGVTELKHVDEIMIKHLIGNNLFKCQFDNNIISFFKSIVETQLLCTINKVKYKVNPVRTDTGKDFNGLTGIDKLEQTLAKLDEGQVIRCNKSLDTTVEALKREWNIYPTDDEIEYYFCNFLFSSPFHMMLLGYCYASIFDGYIEFKNADIFTKCELLIMAKRKMERDKYYELPWLLTSVQKGKSTNRLLNNAKYTEEVTSSSDYINLIEKKYQSLKGYKEDEIRTILSYIVNNIFTYVEYDNQDKTGEEIEFDKKIIAEELLRFADSI